MRESKFGDYLCSFSLKSSELISIEMRYFREIRSIFVIFASLLSVKIVNSEVIRRERRCTLLDAIFVAQRLSANEDFQPVIY